MTQLFMIWNYANFVVIGSAKFIFYWKARLLIF